MRSNFAIRRSLTNVCSWDQMEWNVTGDVTIGTVDADEELCPRYTNILTIITNMDAQSLLSQLDQQPADVLQLAALGGLHGDLPQVQLRHPRHLLRHRADGGAHELGIQGVHRPGHWAQT